MREQRLLIRIFVVILCIAVLSFMALLILRFFLYNNEYCLRYVQLFGDMMNLIVGLISGIIVTFALSIGKYFSEKRKVMTTLMIELIRMSKLFVSYNNASCITQKIESIKNISEYDKTNFNLTVGKICFLFNNKKHFGRIHKEIYKEIFFWFQSSYAVNELIKSGVSLESDILKEAITKLDGILLENGKSKFSKLIDVDINKWFYELAYGRGFNSF